jgi:hypothetical protein
VGRSGKSCRQAAFAGCMMMHAAVSCATGTGGVWSGSLPEDGEGAGGVGGDVVPFAGFAWMQVVLCLG